MNFLNECIDDAAGSWQASAAVIAEAAAVTAAAAIAATAIAA
jgi:hypothetical protein